MVIGLDAPIGASLEWDEVGAIILDATVDDDESIILMDWLNDNVIGSIPAKEEMSERAQAMVSVAGVREDDIQAEKVEN